MPALVATQRLAALKKGGGASPFAFTFNGQPFTFNGRSFTYGAS